MAVSNELWPQAGLAHYVLSVSNNNESSVAIRSVIYLMGRLSNKYFNFKNPFFLDELTWVIGKRCPFEATSNNVALNVSGEVRCLAASCCRELV